jgi:hypothetical protein
MNGNTALSQWSGVLVEAPSELTDREILQRYGGLMQSAVVAFRQDPSYIVEMAETSASIRARRSTRQKRAS